MGWYVVTGHRLPYTTTEQVGSYQYVHVKQLSNGMCLSASLFVCLSSQIFKSCPKQVI